MTVSTPHDDASDGADEQRFEALAELIQTVTGSLDLSEALERVAHAATTLLPDAAARIWVVEERGLALRAEAGTRGPARSGRATELGFGEGLTGHVALTAWASCSVWSFAAPSFSIASSTIA
jgi:signal transduction protein with GAF and PtsI domain